MKNNYLFLLVLICLSGSVIAQRGKNGPVIVNSVVTVNEYTSLTADASVGNTSITVKSSTMNAHGRFSSNLKEGDLVMIIQMQGATINGIPNPLNTHISTPNDSSWGAVTSYNNCGNNEIREVLSVPNATTINLTCPLVNNYTAAGKVQIVRVPRYSTLTINAGGEIVPDLWDSVSGGIIAIEVLGNTVINAGGQINAYASGFRGGIIKNSNAIATGVTYFSSNQPNINGAFKGESIAGNGTDYDVFGGYVCMGAPANGGGGGDSWNGGGGGGANGGNVSGWINGFGIPDISQPQYITAWNLEYTWMSSFVGAGGGRGGYTWSNSGDPQTVPPGDPSWAGDSRRSVGGRGGHPLDYTTGRLFFGGGGGAGSEDNNHAGPGGNGGGMIYLSSYGTISGSGTILANGHDGVSDSLAAGDGPGGAGGGGAIVINSVGAISGITIQANGGTGGGQRNTSPEGEGPGGGGGGGYISTSNMGMTKQVNGGPNGLTTTFPTFPQNGSTAGGPGDTTAITNFIIVSSNDTICPNQTATLTATLSGTVPLGTTIEWSDSLIGGTQLGSGSSFTTPVLTTTTVFFVGTCPGDYRQPDTVFVRNVAASITPLNDSICKGDSVLLIGSGGTSYQWSNGKTNDSIEVSPIITTTYTLTAFQGLCSNTSTVTIYVTTALTTTIKAVPDTVCPLGSSRITANPSAGQVTYKWNTGATSSFINVNPTGDTKYIVTIYGKCDTVKDSVTVIVIPLPKPVITGTLIKCQGVKDTLYASGGTTYSWSGGSTSTSYITGPINADSIVILTAYNSLGCPHDTTFDITITTPTVIPTVDTLACKGNVITLNAGSGAGLRPYTYLWAPGGYTSDSLTVIDTAQKTYTVTITNAEGCKEIKTIKVIPDIIPLTACCNAIIIKGNDTIMMASGATRYLWQPSSSLNCDTCATVIASPTVTTTYTVIGTDSLGCQVEELVTIEVESPCFNFIVPNVFTPTYSGPYGENNELYIKTENLDSWSILIYDRWGKEMYSSTNATQYWQGTSKDGGEAPSGVYYYIINATCQGNTYKKDGFVQLIR